MTPVMSSAARNTAISAAATCCRVWLTVLSGSPVDDNPVVGVAGDHLVVAVGRQVDRRRRRADPDHAAGAEAGEQRPVGRREPADVGLRQVRIS